MMQFKGTSARGFRFQLTALVDLLLIIVFMQFLELKQHQSTTENAFQSELQSVRDSSNQQLQKLQAGQLILKDALEESSLEAERTAKLANAYEARLDQAMRAIQSAFQDVAKSAPSDSVPVDLEKQLQAIATSNPDQVLRFLVGYDELLKRAEVWTLHARASGEIVIQAGDETNAFRLESASQSERADEFAERLFASYKQFPQPKGLVIILSSYDFRATAGVYQSVIDGLPRAVDRMRSDAAQIRFEYSVLGPSQDPIPSTTDKPSQN